MRCQTSARDSCEECSHHTYRCHTDSLRYSTGSDDADPQIHSRLLRRFSGAGPTTKGRIYKPGTIQEVASEDQLRAALSQDDKHVIVSFFTDNCEGCKKVIPRFQQRAAKVTKDFNIMKIDLFKHDNLAEKFQVEFAPHAFLFYNGKVIGEFKGGNITDSELDEFFKPLLA